MSGRDKGVEKGVRKLKFGVGGGRFGRRCVELSLSWAALCQQDAVYVVSSVTWHAVVGIAMELS